MGFLYNTLKYPIMGICYFFRVLMAPCSNPVPTVKTLGTWRYILVYIDCETVKDTSAWALLLKKKLII